MVGAGVYRQEVMGQRGRGIIFKEGFVFGTVSNSLLTQFLYSSHIIMLFMQVKSDSFNKDQIAGYVHKAYGCPPMTYALKLLFSNQSLRQFGCWVNIAIIYLPLT